VKWRALVAWVAMLAVCAGPAFAQRDRERDREAAKPPVNAAQDEQRRREEARRIERREPSRPERMRPEEREKLRRDIEDANRNIPRRR
jgi:hypothetical protein